MAQQLALMLLASGIGIPAAFFTIALPAIMRDGGASLMQIGLVYLVWLPSVIKFLWAPLAERFAATDRTRKQAVQLLTSAMAASFIPVSWLAEEMAAGWLLALAVLTAALGLMVVEDVDHTRTKANSPQTNGICERFHRTIKDEFYDIAFRKKLYRSVEELQVDLDAWLAKYNEQRPHSGRYCYGKTPMQTFRETLHIARDKTIRASGTSDSQLAILSTES